MERERNRTCKENQERQVTTMEKWMIASDIHGSAANCAKLLAKYKEENAERLILLGDLLYHGPRNDLPEEYAPKEVIRMLNEVKNELICVRGNCEAEVDQMVLEFPVLADYAILCVDGIQIFATHGHHYNKTSLPPMKPGDILLHGHTHVTALEDNGSYYYLNPGSVSIPKDGTKKSYLIYENRRFTLKTLDGEVQESLTV